MYLAENLKYLREKKGMTQESFASMIGEIGQKAVSKWETGEREPELSRLIKIAKFFDVSIDDLLLKDLRPPVPQYASNIRYLRIKYDLKQEEIGKLLGVTIATVCKYEKGNIEPTVSQLLTLSDFFGVSMDQMIKQDLSQEVVECSH